MQVEFESLSSLFRGQSFCTSLTKLNLSNDVDIITDVISPQRISRSKLEAIVKEHGGRIVQTISDGESHLIADKGLDIPSWTYTKRIRNCKSRWVKAKAKSRHYPPKLDF